MTETFLLDEAGDGTRLRYGGGTDLWRAGALWGWLVAEGIRDRSEQRAAARRRRDASG